MTAYALTKTRFQEGVWEGLITAVSDDMPAPEIAVTHLDQPLRGVTVTEAAQPARWVLEIPVPVDSVGDGVHTFLILDTNADAVLGSFCLIAGEALGDDIRAEMELLRAELDMLKRAFRRHCVETM